MQKMTLRPQCRGTCSKRVERSATGTDQSAPTVRDGFRGEGTAHKNLKELEEFCKVLGREKDVSTGKKHRSAGPSLLATDSDEEHWTSKLVGVLH